MPGSLPGQRQKMYSSQPELNNNWTKVSYKSKEGEHWLNQTSTSSPYTALLEEESEDQQQKASPENTPKPPPISITDLTNISLLIQLLEQIAKQQKEIKALTGNQVKVQPKTSES
jgi:hypothetical protein